MANFGQLFQNRRVVILDGGLGTTLETMFHQDISSPLWSAKSINENPHIIIEAHLAFLRAGARVILTSTYQASFNTFQQANYSRADAEQIMLKSVKLADEARQRFIEERDDVSQQDVRIALSLGPYGACVFPGQEYDGFYPPPFGPKAFSEGENYNAFDDEIMAENSIHALSQFHLERLQVFARNPEAWISIDCIAFETVPLAREVKGIRRAIGLLQKERVEDHLMKPWWISLVFPCGRYPETEHPGGQNLNVRHVAEAALGNESHSPLPCGIGLNCLQTEFLPALLSGLQEVMDDIGDKRMARPWLAIYPNGGEIYDPISRTWKANSIVEKAANVWADKLGEIANEVVRQRTWGGVLVGGCCRTGPEEIKVLSHLLLG